MTRAAGVTLLAAAGVVVGLAHADQTHCDPTYDCEFFYESPAEGLIRWNLAPLCSPSYYFHSETDRLGTNFTFNICGLSAEPCGPADPNNTAIPTYGVAVQNYGNDTCVIAGEGFPTFTPLDPQNVQTGGINITHEAAPQLEETGKACPSKLDGTIVARSTKYLMRCDPDAAELQVLRAYEESECQYVIEMATSYACGQPNGDPGGNCQAPGIPAGVSTDCRANVVPLDEAMVGPQAAYDAVNQACEQSCSIRTSEDCNADCDTDLDLYVAACTKNGGATYGIQIQITYDPPTPGAPAPVTDIKEYTCIAQQCANEDDEASFDHFYTDRLCGYADGGTTTQSCDVTFQGLVAPSPSPTPSPSMAPSASAAPSASSAPAVSPVPLPSASATPAPPASPAPDSGGTAAAAIFGTGFGLAFLLFGGYHLSTRMGWVQKDSVPSSARNCLECGCCAPLLARFRGGSGISERSSFAAGGGGTFSSSSGVGGGGVPASSSSGFGTGGSSAAGGGGYQNI